VTAAFDAIRLVWAGVGGACVRECMSSAFGFVAPWRPARGNKLLGCQNLRLPRFDQRGNKLLGCQNPRLLRFSPASFFLFFYKT
jgi:hypothetical protein